MQIRITAISPIVVNVGNTINYIIINNYIVLYYQINYYTLLGRSWMNNGHWKIDRYSYLVS